MNQEQMGYLELQETEELQVSVDPQVAMDYRVKRGLQENVDHLVVLVQEVFKVNQEEMEALVYRD